MLLASDLWPVLILFSFTPYRNFNCAHSFHSFLSAERLLNPAFPAIETVMDSGQTQNA
jgi:hypothetical protein